MTKTKLLLTIIVSTAVALFGVAMIVAGTSSNTHNTQVHSVFGYVQNVTPDYESFGQVEAGALGFPASAVTGNEPVLRLTADKLCEALRKGVSRQDVAAALVDTTSNVGTVQANQVVDAAVQYVCSGR
jgi:hypothetical protein